MIAVVDRFAILEDTIDHITSPYHIWNDPNLEKGQAKCAYVLVPGHTRHEKFIHDFIADVLSRDPNMAVKKVYCGN